MKLVKEYLGKVSITVEKDYWTSDKSYDRLVIVEVLNVGCYISRKPVPRGTQYDNREYWIRMSKNVVLSPSPEPIEFPIVTEFGDNVDVTIAQKTLTDARNDIIIDIDNINDTINDINNGITEINETLYNINASIRNINEDVWLSNLRHKPIVYISGRLTYQANDTNLLAAYNNEFGLTESGTVIYENYMPSNKLRYIIDNPEEFGDGIELWLNEIVIVQFDSIQETIGTFDSGEQLDLDNPSDYPNTFYGNVSYFLDRLNTEARTNGIKPTVFLIAPIRIRDHERDAIETLAKATGAIYVDGYNFRYDYNLVTTISLDGDTKKVLNAYGIDYWVDNVCRSLKLNC